MWDSQESTNPLVLLIHFSVHYELYAFMMKCLASGACALQVRVPEWTEASRMQVLLDSRPVMCSSAADEADAYCSIVRSFRTGDLQQAGCRLDMPVPDSCTCSIANVDYIQGFSWQSHGCRPTLGCQAAHDAAPGDSAGAAHAPLAAECPPRNAFATSTADYHSTFRCVQDDRPVFRAFKSLLIGPHLYAGLTHGQRTMVADTKQIASMVVPLTSEGMLE
jgi:hypothetical protein